MEESFEGAFPVDYGLPHREKKRYAKANQVFRLGLWGHNLKLIKGVELTTRLGHKNTWKDMKQDNQNLRKKLRKNGILANDCFCAEISPKNHLLHLHGFYRLIEPMPAVELHRILSPYWGDIHEAPVVWVQDIYSAEGLMMYNVKHALKNYSTLEFGNMRMLKSKGWLPVGYREVIRILVKWALEHGAQWDADENDISGFRGEYIAYAWDVMQDYLWKWCNDELITLEFRDSVVEIWGDEIRETRADKVYRNIEIENEEELIYGIQTRY